MLCGSFLEGRLVPTTLLVELMYLSHLWNAPRSPSDASSLYWCTRDHKRHPEM